MDFETIGGRRFSLAVGTMIGTMLLTWFGKITGDVYSVITIATVGALIAGHTVENVKNITTSASK